MKFLKMCSFALAYFRWVINGASMKTRQRLEIIPRVVDTNQRRIILNVGGRKHETYLSTVRNYPDTRLYWVVENVTKAIDYDSEKIEVFFDRHPGIFEQVLNYYRTGKLHCPHDVCGPLFEEELAYWGIDEKEMEHCCWTSYSQHRDAEQNLKSFNVHEDDLDQDTDLENDRIGDTTPARDCGRFTWWTKYQPKIWPILEDPHSSKAAKVRYFVPWLPSFHKFNKVCYCCKPLLGFVCSGACNID